MKPRGSSLSRNCLIANFSGTGPGSLISLASYLRYTGPFIFFYTKNYSSDIPTIFSDTCIREYAVRWVGFK